MTEGSKTESPRQAVAFAEFLESSPPDVEETIGDLVVQHPGRPGLFRINRPHIQLHCPSDPCGGIRIFESSADAAWVAEEWSSIYISYVCRNCRRTLKTYALAVRRDANGPSGTAQKFGEIPTFGPPVPSRVIKLIGPDREVFLRGRRSENHGLGIGAFAYYRRVVENQKGRIIKEMGKVAQKLGASTEIGALFAAAEQETQFSKAIETIKSAIPESLRVDGHNPLTLLHDALSEGLHANTDEECLVLATSIRVILTELADRMSQALKDDAELKEAVSRLLNRHAKT